MKDKIILHEAGIINIKLKNSRTHRFRIVRLGTPLSLSHYRNQLRIVV